MRTSILLTTCDTGAGLLQRPLMEQLSYRTLSSLANSAVHAGQTIPVTLNEFVLKLAEPGIEPITMHTVGRRTKDIQVKQQGEDVKQTEKSQAIEQPTDVEKKPPSELGPGSPIADPYGESASGEFVPGMTIDIGIAAYKDDKMVGLLDAKEARGYLWLTGRLDHTAINIPCPLGTGEMIALDVIRANSKIKPVFQDGIKMKAEIHVDMEGAQFPFRAYFRDPATIKDLEDLAKELVTREIRQTLERVQKEMKSDIYGFGNKVYQTRPDLWAKLEKTWNDYVFPDLEVVLDIHTRIRAPGAVFGLSDH